MDPSGSAKKDQLPLWMGSYLKPGKSSQLKYFKPEGASSTFYSTKVNTNLGKLADGSLKEKHVISLTDKDTKVAETFAKESSALHSHLLWLMDLLMALNRKMKDPSTRAPSQPIVSQVLGHQKWVQALMPDSLA